MDVEDIDNMVQDNGEDEDERWNEPLEADSEGGGQPVGTRQNTGCHPSLLPKVTPSGAALSSTGTNSIMSRMALNDNKAGMDGLDKERINKIILEASKGSRFYENERKREAQVNRRIEEMMGQLAGITMQQRASALEQVDAVVAALEASRDHSRSIVHLDMDAFYAAVEMRDNPTLKNKPMAVGGMSMLSTSNYHARRYGVRAAMPGFIAKKLCPELVIVPTNFDKYRTVSEQVRGILAQYDPNFCPMSLDEAYFDLTDHLERRRNFGEAERTFEYRTWNSDANNSRSGKKNSSLSTEIRDPAIITLEKDPKHSRPCDVAQQHSENPCQNGNQTSSLNGNSTDPPALTTISSLGTKADVAIADNTPQKSQRLDGIEEISHAKGERSRTFGLTVEDVVEEIRFRIEQKTQLTASAGIAPNVMLAKICSDKNKPNGQYRILPNRDSVMEFIRQLPIRKVSGIGKVTERMLSALGIQNCTDLFEKRALLHLLFSATSSQHFLRISLGIGSTRVERDGERKSMSTERTFSEMNRPADLYEKCHELCQALAEDLQKEQLMGKTITIKIKTVQFEVKTKANSVPTCINSADSIFSVAKDLLRTEINACKPEPLRLRLMGVRLSNLQPYSAVDNKQDSITKFFKKQPTPSLQTSQSLQNDDVMKPGSPIQTTASLHNSTQDSSSVTTSEPEASTLSSKFPKTSGEQTSDDSGQKVSRFEDKVPSYSEENPDRLSAPCELVCPVCNTPQPGTDLDGLNDHVDVCLNRGAIREMLKQQSNHEKSDSLHSSPTKGKRHASGPKSAAKRRKQEKLPTNTLDKFFS